MKKVATLKTLLLFIAVCLFIAVLGVALREKKRPIVVNQQTVPATETDANLEMNNVSYSTLASDNFKLWDLNAQTARIFEDGNKILLEDLHITFYQRSGTTYKLSADQGELDMETRNIHINGNVKAVLPDNATIKTQSAFYNNTSRVITSRERLTITRGALTMQGIGLTANLGTETVEILKNVKVIGNK